MTQAPSDPADPVQAALSARQKGRMQEALDTLDAPVREGRPDAALLMLQLAGEDDAPAGSRAFAALALGAAPASPGGQRHLAYVRAAGHAGTADPRAALEARRADAAEGDHAAMTELALIALLAGHEETADALLDAAALRGSGHAVAALLRRGLETGKLSETARDQGPALAQAGHPLAGALMQAAAAVDVRAPYEEGVTALEAIDPGWIDIAAGRPGEGESLCEAPIITRFQAAFPPSLCDYLAAGGAPFLRPASIFDPTTGQERPDPYRRSLTAALPEGAMDLALWAMKARMAALSDCDFAQGEPLALLLYRPEEEYRPHVDYLTEDEGSASADLARRGQRVATSLIKLNEEYEGGQTVFSRLDIAWSGKRGDALSFSNIDPDGQGDPQSLHAGAPVRTGMKILASLWLRERPAGG